MAVLVVTVVALAVRLVRLRFGFAHQIVDFDEGVYFGSSLSLVDGRVPYRDFVFVQPPLVTVLMTPFALLAKAVGSAVALGWATVATAVAGAAAVPLAARLVWHRGARVVVPVVALIAVHGDVVASSYTLLLEPWLLLLSLAAAVLVFRGDELADGRRLLLGGVLLGLACATKIWGVVPLLALALVCLPDIRRLLRLAGGAVLGFAVPVLPFAVLAPGRFVDEVVIVQLTRAPQRRTGNDFRLLHLFGTAPPDGELPGTGRGWLLALAVVVAAGAVVVTLTTLRRAGPLARFAALVSVLVVAMLFVPGTFYWHYAGFAVPLLVIAMALPLSRLRPAAGRVWLAALLVWALLSAVALTVRTVADDGNIDEHAAFAAVVPPGACVVATMPTATVADDRYAGPGCLQVVDPYGTVLTDTGGRQPSSRPPQGAAITARWLRAIASADFVYVDRRENRTLPAGDVTRVLREQFRVVAQPGLSGTLYERVR